jgi:glycosyltransferase involved in cell wall biosynthesis
VTAGLPAAAAPVAAFYTPLKHPEEAEVSGDREIARSLLAGLRACGLAPELASRLLTWRRTLDPPAALRLERRAATVAATLVRRYRRRPARRRPRLWVSYQNYHRCPDLVGPVVATALDVPYVLVDSSVSTRARRTPFRPWLAASRLALRRADLVFAMSPRDLPRLAALRGPAFAAARLRLLPPAVDLARYESSPGSRAATRAELGRWFGPPEAPLLLCVAMMRAADKLDSYRLLGAALGRLAAAAPARPWRLLVVGDGPARAAVEAALAEVPAPRVRLLGALEPAALPPLYAAADLLTFPGIGDALGLVFLEAAAAGLPAVAVQGPGPAVMVPPGGGVLTPADAEAYAAAVARLLDDAEARRRLGAAARQHTVRERSFETFVRRLRAGLGELPGLPGAGGAAEEGRRTRPPGGDGEAR